MKILSITIGLLLVVSVAFAEPIFTEKITRERKILEDGRLHTTEKTNRFKDGKWIGEDLKTIDKVEDLNDRGIAILSVISSPEFISLTEAENTITGIGTEKMSLYQIEVLRDGHIQIREARLTFKDGVKISKVYWRHAPAPGADTTEETQKVKDIAEVVWTPEVVAKYKEKKAAKALENQ